MSFKPTDIASELLKPVSLVAVDGLDSTVTQW